ncbi:MAG: class I SAM-dependent methyltransferase [Chloroflexota bacterium]
MMRNSSSVEEELEHVLCNLCGGDDTKLLLTEQGSPIVECRRCSLVYVNPRLTMQSRDRYYRELQSVPIDEVSPLLPDPEFAHASAMAEYWGKIDRNTLKEYILAFQRGLLTQISAMVPPGRLLDVGCGWGYFLLMAKEEFGYEVHGVDPSKKLAEVCRDQRGLENVVQGSIEEIEVQQGFFDVVTLMDVLEHLADPGCVLQKINTMLRPGGAVFIKVPNVAYLKIKARVFSSKFIMGRLNALPDVEVMHPREHLYNFSPKTLRALLSKHGFEGMRFSYYGGGLTGSGQRDRMLGAYSALARLTDVLSMGRAKIQPNMGVFARKPS